MKKKWNILLYILAVVLIVGGLLALWLPNRTTEGTEAEKVITEHQDTDPDAPFKDLTNWEKIKILQAIKDSYVWGDNVSDFWYVEMSNDPSFYNYTYGLRYYGTFGGYHIIFCPRLDDTPMTTQPMYVRIKYGEKEKEAYSFYHNNRFELFAYKDGVINTLNTVVFEKGISIEQLAMIHQCYEQYNKEVYVDEIGLFPEDTDPNAPFVDLPEETKKQILASADKFIADMGWPIETFWYGEKPPLSEYGPLESYGDGVRYYGTFNGYHIVMVPNYNIDWTANTDKLVYVYEYNFYYDRYFTLLACKENWAMRVNDAYAIGRLSYEQLGLIYQCYERYNREVYTGKEG